MGGFPASAGVIAHKPIWLSRYIDDQGILDQKGPAVEK
jgi:hypothetical protein